METFQFGLRARWDGGRLGSGHLAAGNLDVAVSIPGEMGGPGIGTNPDELLLAAAANCYMITLAALLERRLPQPAGFELYSEGVVERDGNRLTYRRIVHRPVIRLEAANEQARDEAIACALRAEQSCMISRALKGNVDITVEPSIEHS
jgi:peroxiredoxin-like protein